jgi:hypothetical protein
VLPAYIQPSARAINCSDGCHCLTAQLIRDAIAKQTGVEPPAAPPPPRVHAYGDLELYESASLLSQIPRLYPGDGITSAQPLIMEEYGQGCVLLNLSNVWLHVARQAALYAIWLLTFAHEGCCQHNLYAAYAGVASLGIGPRSPRRS